MYTSNKLGKLYENGVRKSFYEKTYEQKLRRDANECLLNKISCVLMVYSGAKSTCGNRRFCINIRPYFTVKIIFCVGGCLVCNVHLYSAVLSDGKKILFSCRVDIIIDD